MSEYIVRLRDIDHFQRSIRMTFKTIDRNGGGDMTTRTKMLLVIDASDLAVCIGCDMAINAFDQAGFFGANALMHGLITLVQEHIHVFTTHLVDWGYAGFTFGCGLDIAVSIAIRAGIVARHHLCEAKQQDNGEILDHDLMIT